MREVKLIILLDYKQKGIEFTKERAEKDYFGILLNNETERNIFGNTIGVDLEVKDLDNYLDSIGKSKNVYYRLRRRILTDMIIMFSGKYELREIG